MSDLRLHPAESMALNVARGMASRGDDITPNIAAFLVLTLDRLLSDPAAEDSRHAAAWSLVQAWELQAICARADAAVAARSEGYAALVRESRVTGDHAAELRRVLERNDARARNALEGSS